MVCNIDIDPIKVYDLFKWYVLYVDIMNHSPSQHLQHKGKGGKRIPEYQKSTTHAAFQMPWGSVEGRCHAHGSHKVSHTVVLCGACSINTSAFLMKHCQKAKENWETCEAFSKVDPLLQSQPPVFVSTNHNQGGNPMSAFPVVKVVQVPPTSWTLDPVLVDSLCYQFIL